MKAINTRLQKIQTELKAPKGQFNKFGNYKYRSCEDIVESIKPLLTRHNCSLLITDDIKQVGDRFYIEATVLLTDCESGEQVFTKALAREAENKKGMDESQITGSTSSYARKYALNGMFAIDDTKDADTQDNSELTEDQKKKIDSFTDLEELRIYYEKNKGLGTEFSSYVANKVKQLKV